MSDSTDLDKNTREKSTKENIKYACCGSFSFHWLFGLSLYQLLAYLHKLYQDFNALGHYYNRGSATYVTIAAFCLIIPAIIYIFYLLFIYLKDTDHVKKNVVGTKLVEGFLLIPWQIKSRVEVLHFSAQRSCQRRILSEDEVHEYSSLSQQAHVLEFFEGFFAGFMQLAFQLYIIVLYFEYPTHSTYPLVGAIVGSAITLFGVMFSVQREDDGYITRFLSISGWALVIVSRTFAIAVAANVIYEGILVFCFLHALIITFWLTPICWHSYTETELSKRKKIATCGLVFLLFGLPSLIYWPILFHLRKNKRPLIFMAILFVENIGLFLMWYFMRDGRLWDKKATIYLSLMTGVLILGFVFISIYYFIKRKLKYVDEIALHDMRDGARSFGMYFDFLNVTFHLSVSEKVCSRLKLIRQTELVS